jgi:xanthine dehydrogenase YagT iron-sulfur-binding subunit
LLRVGPMRKGLARGSVAPAIASDAVASPVVIAFGQLPESADELSSIRAHLRGLGTSLVVATEHATWSFRPDDDLERLADHGAEALRDSFGVDGDAVFVVDERGVVRFACTEPRGSLAAALAAAVRALHAATRLQFDRREWLVTSLCTGFALLALGCRERGKPEPTPSPPPPGSELERIVLDVNGKQHRLAVDPRVSLLDVLREQLGLTGTKKGCDMGQCGACTVHIDGKRMLGCLTLAVMASGKKIVTIEGLSSGDRLHPVQTAFIEHDGFQCGYCTPGQIMSAVALLAEGTATTADEIREQMSGNLCRCGAYPNIVAAVQAAARKAPT